MQHLGCYQVESVSLERQEPVIAHRELCLASVYKALGAVPLWVDEGGPTAQAMIILNNLRKAFLEGLDPRDYQVDEIMTLWHSATPADLARLDTLLTYNALKYVHDVGHGRLQPLLVDPLLFAGAGDTSFDPVAIVEEMRCAADLEAFFKEIPPDNDYYRGLKLALVHYRRIATQEWDAIGAGPSIYPGDADQRVPLIRQRLAALAGNGNSGRISIEYDKDLEAEVLLFQELHGLKKDGVIGPLTLGELNVTPARRIAQIQINMARWRWHDHRLGEDYILVNIADYTLYGYRGGELQLTLPVIVGEQQHQTPVFSDKLQYVEFHPYWNIPPSIAKNEELPELRKNPYHLVDRNIRLFSSWQEHAVELNSTTIDWQNVSASQMARYKLRQDPGPDNALGRLKFVFPNHHSVYMHDTPAKNLFNEHDRFFSHGCIRVSQPERLAHFVLQNSVGEWNDERIREVLATGSRSVVLVRPPLNVHLTYQTAWLDKQGRIHFNGDIYGRDEKLYTALLRR